MTTGSQAKKFYLLCRVATISTVILALVDIILNIVLMCFHLCAIEVDVPVQSVLELPDDFFYIFYSNYLAKPSECNFKGGGLAQDHRPQPVYVECSAVTDTYQISYEPPFNATSADSAFIWVIVLLALDCLWLVSAVVMELDFSAKGKPKKPMFWPWVVMTSLILVYGLITGIIFLCDLRFPNKADCSSSVTGLNDKLFEDYVGSWKTAIWVFPMYFLRGFLVWFLLLGFLVWFIMEAVKFGKKQQQDLYMPTRRLSEMVPDSDEEDTDAAKAAAAVTAAAAGAAVANEARQGDSFPEIHQAEERRLSGHVMYYANDAYEPETFANQAVVQRSASNVTNTTRPRRLSDGLSDISETDRERRKIGRPTTQPLSNNDEYSIPRAKINPRGQRNSAAIRTPSGRSVRASDYLRDQRLELDVAAAQEQYKEGDRYFVKLKD